MSALATPLSASVVILESIALVALFPAFAFIIIFILVSAYDSITARVRQSEGRQLVVDMLDEFFFDPLAFDPAKFTPLTTEQVCDESRLRDCWALDVNRYHIVIDGPGFIVISLDDYYTEEGQQALLISYRVSGHRLASCDLSGPAPLSFYLKYHERYAVDAEVQPVDGGLR